MNPIKSMADDTHEEYTGNERMENVINVGDTERIVSGVAGGVLVYNGLTSLGRHPFSGLIKTLIGGFLLYRGASGTCPLYKALGKTDDLKRTPTVRMRTSVVVEKPREEVYAFWRKLENLPLFIKHLQRVQEHSEVHSTWTAELPGYGLLQWNAEVVKEVDGHFLGWQSVEGAPIENAGKVEFFDFGPGRTELKVVIAYRPPAGDLGVLIAKALNPAFTKLIESDIYSFKERMETMTW